VGVRDGHLDKNRTKKNISWLQCSGAVPLLLLSPAPSPSGRGFLCLSEQPRKITTPGVARSARPPRPSFSPHQPFGTCTAHNAAHPVLFGCLATITKSPACFLYGIDRMRVGRARKVLLIILSVMEEGLGQTLLLRRKKKFWGDVVGFYFRARTFVVLVWKYY
jgi:hypothetical protein